MRIINLIDNIKKDIDANSYQEVEHDCSTIYSDGAMVIEIKKLMAILEDHLSSQDLENTKTTKSDNIKNAIITVDHRLSSFQYGYGDPREKGD